MINKKFKILLIEDNPVDAQLIKIELGKILTAHEAVVVSKMIEVEEAIPFLKPDIILSDYNLNSFNGMDVLNLVNQLPYEIPLIFVTGTINDEEVAANTILNGASGYVLKNNITHLHERLLPHFEKLITFRTLENIKLKLDSLVVDIEAYLADSDLDTTHEAKELSEIKQFLDRYRV